MSDTEIKKLQEELKQTRKWSRLWKKKARYWRNAFESHDDTGSAKAHYWLMDIFLKGRDSKEKP